MSSEREFELTEEHIALLRNLEFTMQDWEHPGAPGADPKRPYGNSGHNAICDIAEMLDIAKPADGADYNKNEWEEWESEVLAIWNGTSDALQIILDTQSFEPGIYIKERGFQWVRKDDEPPAKRKYRIVKTDCARCGIPLGRVHYVAPGEGALCTKCHDKWRQEL